MNAMVIDCAAELAVALGRSEADLEKEVRLASALKLFEMGRISSGLAAKLAKMSRVEFLLLCGHYNVSVFQQDSAEMESDTFTALKASRT